MLESVGLHGIPVQIPVDSALDYFSLTAMVNSLEKVNTHVAAPRWRNGGWEHPPRDSRRNQPVRDRGLPRQEKRRGALGALPQAFPLIPGGGPKEASSSPRLALKYAQPHLSQSAVHRCMRSTCNARQIFYPKFLIIFDCSAGVLPDGLTIAWSKSPAVMKVEEVTPQWQFSFPKELYRLPPIFLPLPPPLRDPKSSSAVSTAFSIVSVGFRDLTEVFCGHDPS